MKYIKKIDRVLANIFFNNQRKRSSESVSKDKFVTFKKSKREK